MNLMGDHMVGSIAYKLTVELDEKHKEYTRILARRLKFKSKDELIAHLIEEKAATMFDY